MTVERDDFKNTETSKNEDKMKIYEPKICDNSIMMLLMVMLFIETVQTTKFCFRNVCK